MIISLSVLAVGVFAAPLTFVVDDPAGRNVVQFTSQAPIETIVGTTSNVTGKVTFDPQNLQSPAQAKVSVDLKSVTTGIDMRDEHMRDEKYLNTKVFPIASFELSQALQTSVKSIKPGQSADLTFKGSFTLHGVTREVTVKGRVSYFSENKDLAPMGYPGEMINFDGEFNIKLPDFGIAVPQMLLLKLSEDVKIHVNFTATTGR